MPEPTGRDEPGRGDGGVRHVHGAHAHAEHAYAALPEHPGHPYEIWDVFTATPLEGNPLGVFPQAEELPSRLYQRLARELNLSETVFISPDDPAEADAAIRIFTPTLELPFAGHPTLGAAYAVGTRHGYATVRLRTGAGIIRVALTRDDDGEIVSGEMQQPVPTVTDHPDPAGLLAALGLEHSELAVELYTNGPSHVVITAERADQVSALTPDLSSLARLGVHGVAVIAQTGPNTVITRNFCPALGVPEDPATGSAAGPIAVHLLRHGRVSAGTAVTISQGAEIGRPSELVATAWGSPDAIERVTVAGAAVRVASGHYDLS
jgi:trans-2,3-dihydro-3-hydroxyanthranilate isomerase